MKNTEYSVGEITPVQNISCVYTHTFSDKSVYVGCGKTIGIRDQSFEPRNDTYAEKLSKYGNPIVSIVNTFDTTEGTKDCYETVAKHEREVYLLLRDMGVEMINKHVPKGVPSMYWLTGDKHPGSLVHANKNDEGKSIHAVEWGRKMAEKLHVEKDEEGKSVVAVKAGKKAYETSKGIHSPENIGKGARSQHSQKDESGRSIHAVKMGAAGGKATMESGKHNWTLNSPAKDLVNGPHRKVLCLYTGRLLSRAVVKKHLKKYCASFGYESFFYNWKNGGSTLHLKLSDD